MNEEKSTKSEAGNPKSTVDNFQSAVDSQSDDALIAAPKHHKLLFENEFVRVLDTNIAPGEMTNVHTHRYPASLYILSWSDFIRYDAEGNVLVDSTKLEKFPKEGSALWSEPLAPHALKNVGKKELHVISVEIKNVLA